MLCFLLVIINSGIIKYYIGYFILALYEFFLYQMAAKRKIAVGFLSKSPIWLLTISGLIYGIAVYVLGQKFFASITLYCLMPALIFATGYTITNQNGMKGVFTAEKCLCAIAVGCAIHVIFNVYANHDITSRGKTVDFFTGQLAATNLGSLNTYIFALLPCLIITKKKKIKIIGLLFFILSVVYALILGTRTTVYALCIMTAISFFIYVRRHYPKGIKLNVLLKWSIIGVVFIGGLYWVYSTNFLSIRSKIAISSLALRYRDIATRASDSLRLKYFQKGIVYLFEHPLGGNKVSGLNYFHNYWLDVGRVAGVFPVVLIAIMDVLLFRHMFAIFRNKEIGEDFRYALFGIYICVFLNFFMEPIMDGYFDLFYRFILINGMTEGLYDRFPQNRKNMSG